jgi:hypothetical protein
LTQYQSQNPAAGDPDVAAEWLEELDWRAREVTGGTAKLEDWTEVRRRIERRLQTH